MESAKYLILMVSFIALAGCAGKSGTSTGSMTGDTGADGYDDGSAYPIDDDSMGEGSALGDDSINVMQERIVYFEFDSNEVLDEFDEVVAAHGRYLADNPGERVRLEGHADERGSREYNIGLGERRSQSVKDILLIQGATSDQLVTVSFGEERPASIGSDETAWSENRRVEFVYER